MTGALTDTINKT